MLTACTYIAVSHFCTPWEFDFFTQTETGRVKCFFQAQWQAVRAAWGLDEALI